MVDLIELTNAMAGTFQNIAALLPLMENGQASIVPYIDENPTSNSVSRAIYAMAAGSLLIAWNLTTLELATTSMLAWTHILIIYVRAQRGASALTIINTLIDGVPEPGDGGIWRFCPLLPGCLPTDVREVVRLIDEEGIDFYAITTATQETGDTGNPATQLTQTGE